MTSVCHQILMINPFFSTSIYEYWVSELELAALFEVEFESLLCDTGSSVIYIVGEAPKDSNLWNLLIEKEKEPNYKKYMYNNSQIVLVFPTLICFLNQMSNYSSFERLHVISIDRTMSQKYFTGRFLNLQATQCAGQRLNTSFTHICCIPPNDEGHQRLLAFLRYQKASNFEPSEKIFCRRKIESEDLSKAAEEDDRVSGKDCKDFADLHFKYEGRLSHEASILYDMSELKLSKQYYQFSESIDQLKMLRLDLSEVCTYQSKRLEMQQNDIKNIGMITQLSLWLTSLVCAVKSSSWNPKWVECYDRVEKACKAVCDIITPNCVNGSKRGELLPDSVKELLPDYLESEMVGPNDFDRVFLCFQPDHVKLLLENMVDTYKHFSVGGAVEQRNVFREEFFRKRFETAKNSDTLKSCLREATLSLYVILKFPTTNEDCYKHVIAIFNEIITRANEQKQVFESFSEDKVLSDLVLYDIGNKLLKLNTNMSELKLSKQYYQFSESIDQLKVLRLDLSKVCTYQSMSHEIQHNYIKDIGMGTQLSLWLHSLICAVNSFFWNPKWVKCYDSIEKACETVCDIITAYCVNGLKRGEILSDLNEYETVDHEYFDYVFFYYQPDHVKSLLKNMVDTYQHFSAGGTIEQRNVFSVEFFRKRFETAKNSDTLKSCLNEAALSFYVILKFPTTNEDCYKYVIATFNEIIRRANERKQVFESFSEDKVLSDLVLYDIGYKLLKLKLQQITNNFNLNHS